MGDAVAGARDRAVAELARTLFNRLDMAKYGEMTQFTVDSERREVHGTLHLKGEEKPVEFHARIHVADQAEGKMLVVDSITTSREWLTLLAAELIQPGTVTIPLPAGAYSILKAIGLGE